MNKNHLKDILKKEGFRRIYEWKDEPGTEYPPHEHKDKVTFYVIDGRLTFYIDNKVIELKKGDRFDVSVRKEHTAKVGSEGCSYIVGEMIEGDS